MVQKLSGETYDSDFSPSSSTETLTNKADNQKKIAHKNKKVKSDDIVRQENGAVSSDVVDKKV